MSRNLTRAVLVAEDDAFWQHEGLDVEQLQESLEADWASGSFTRGGSTITQQLAKNLYLSPSKNPLRKLRELVIARRLEAELTKSRILELYLNVIEWGDGVYGAEAAARTYFGASASSLGPAESAILAGAIINPRVLNPAHPNARLVRRQGIILGRMRSRHAAAGRSAARERRRPRRQRRASRRKSRRFHPTNRPMRRTHHDRAARRMKILLRFNSATVGNFVNSLRKTAPHSLTPSRVLPILQIRHTSYN